MSRSVKKNPIVKNSGRSKKEDKQIANRTLRRKLKNPEFEIGNNGEYQKHYESWEIIDWITRWTLEDALNEYRRAKAGLLPEWNYFQSEQFLNEHPTEESFINFWKKEMVRK